MGFEHKVLKIMKQKEAEARDKSRSRKMPLSSR